MAYLDEPEVKPLADAIRNEISLDDIAEEFRVPTAEWTRDDIVLQTVGAILEFEDWYFDNESVVNDWTPSNPKDYSDTALYPIVKQYVEESLQELRDLDELPNEPDIDVLTNKLVGMVKEFPNWYYGYRKERDLEEWYEQLGNNEAIYADGPDPDYDARTDYGDIDKNMGTGNVYDEDFQPWEDIDLDNGYDYTEPF